MLLTFLTSTVPAAPVSQTRKARSPRTWTISCRTSWGCHSHLQLEPFENLPSGGLGSAAPAMSLSGTKARTRCFFHVHAQKQIMYGAGACFARRNGTLLGFVAAWLDVLYAIYGRAETDLSTPPLTLTPREFFDNETHRSAPSRFSNVRNVLRRLTTFELLSQEAPVSFNQQCGRYGYVTWVTSHASIHEQVQSTISFPRRSLFRFPSSDRAQQEGAPNTCATPRLSSFHFQ